MAINWDNIKRVEFSKTPSFGNAPVFWVKFNRNEKSEFEGIRNTKLEGSFEGDITQVLFDKICSILKEADFINLEKSYKQPGTCQSTEIVKVVLGDGTEIAVQDYGNAGPAKLKKAKEQIKSLLYKVWWSEVEPRYKPTQKEIQIFERKKECHCGSGKRFENCHGLER